MKPTSLGELARAYAAGAAIDRSALCHVEPPDLESLWIRAEAGAKVATVEARLRAAGLTLGSQPPSVRAGDVSSWLEGRHGGRRAESGRSIPAAAGLQAVLPDGSVFVAHPVPRSAAGPSLLSLFLGGGGKVGLIAAAWLRAEPLLPLRRLAFRGAGAFELARRWIFDHPPFALELHGRDLVVVELATEGALGRALRSQLHDRARELGLREIEPPEEPASDGAESELLMEELRAEGFPEEGAIRLFRITRERAVAVGGPAGRYQTEEEAALLGRIAATLRSGY